MAEKNEELRQLYRQFSKKPELEAMAASLRGRQKELTAQVKQHKRAAKAELRDVKLLERPSVTALLYHVTGKLESRLEAERAEAETAQQEYDAAAEALESITGQIADTEAQLAELDAKHQRFQQLMAQKQSAIRDKNGPDAEKIAGKQRTLTFLDSQLAFLAEAAAAGRIAGNAVSSARSELESASLQTHFAGNRGLLSGTMSLREKLAQVQSLVRSLDAPVSAFEKKLAMTSVRGKLDFSPDIRITGSGIFDSDIAARDRISQAEDQLNSLQIQITQRLDQIRRETEQAQRKKQKTVDALERMLIGMDWEE